MLEKLRDPIWQVLLGVIAVLITISIFLLEQTRKEISYQVVSETLLVSTQDEVQGRLQILFDGKEVKNVTLLVIKVQNSGNTPIESKDYDKPIVFKFDEDTEILSTEILSTSPKELGVTLSPQNYGFSLSPVLLNSGDSVEIKVIISNYKEAPEVGARIVGVKSINQINNKKRLNVIFLIGAWILTFINLGASKYFNSYAGNRRRFFIAIDILLVAFMLGMTIYMAFNNYFTMQFFQ